MGFIKEFIAIANDIKEINYSKSSIIQKLQCKYYMHKLKNSIEKIKDDELSTKMISEFADFYLEEFHLNSDRKNHIKQILKGNYDSAKSITFEFDLPDYYVGMITVNFTDRYSTIADYIFSIYGPNSVNHLIYTENGIASYTADYHDEGYLSSIGKSNFDKLNQLKYVFVKEVAKEVKEFLYSNLKVKEITTDGKSG